MTKLETYHAAVAAQERRISAAHAELNRAFVVFIAARDAEEKVSYAELNRAFAVFNAARDAEEKVSADLVKMADDTYKTYTGPR